MTTENRQHLNAIVICLVVIGFITGIEWLRSHDFHKKEEIKEEYVPQFVVFSFDGSRAVPIWEKTRKFAQEMKDAGKPVHFTYFLSAAYFLTQDNKNVYAPPNEARGGSNIGFADSINEIKKRINEINMAKAEGHEIGSHAVGHFSGGLWSRDDWNTEFNFFDSIVFSTSTIAEPVLNVSPNEIVGFRAPYLSKNSHLYESLADHHFMYDSSEVSRDNSWPTKDENGIWHIPLGVIRLGQDTSQTIAMDYNIFAKETHAESTIKRGQQKWDDHYGDILKAYQDYFNKNYNGDRAPVIIGYHFEEWNDELYWQVLKDFATDVCGRPQVRCTSFKELVDYLNTKGIPDIARTGVKADVAAQAARIGIPSVLSPEEIGPHSDGD